MYKILVPFIFLISFISCKNEIPNSPSLFVHGKTEWTYALYMAADNNLERFALKNIKEIKENLGSQKVNFVVLLDRANGYDKTEGNWTDTKILELHSGTELNDDVISELGEKNTSDVSTLKEFLEFVAEYYPSEKLVLNIWSHGFGVYPDCKINNNSRSLIQDYTTGYSNECSFSIIDFASTLKNFCELQNKKIDILQFDCCLMQMIEILWQLKDSAEFIIGSQAELPGSGSNHATLYETFTSDLTTKDCATKIIDNFKEKYKNTLVSCTYSAVDINKFTEFSNSFKDFCAEITNNTSIDFALIKENRENLYNYDSNFIEYADFLSFISIFESEISEESRLEDFCSKLIQNYNEMNINFFASNSYSEKLNGIGINIPYNEKLYSYYNQNSDDYLDIYKTTALPSLIKKIVYAN